LCVGVDDLGVTVLDLLAGTFGPRPWQGGEDFKFVACCVLVTCLEVGN
jgi:hypothetical protein